MQRALEGELTEHHRFLLRQLLGQYDFLEKEIASVSERLGAVAPPSFRAAVEKLDAMAGVGAPTGRRVEIAVVVIVQFKDGKIAGEHIYWDQASVLAQVGLIDAEKLPATGIEASRKVIDASKAPSNRLIRR